MRQKFGLILLIIFAIMMTLGAAPPPDAPPTPPSFLYLKYATFDPLQSAPVLPQTLRSTAATDDNAYIVQFNGVIQDEWLTALTEAGGIIESYLPDNAYLVHLNGEALTRINQLDAVRWVGVFQPAYKLSPNIERAEGNRYKVQLASWANTENVRTAVAPLVDSVGGTGDTLVIGASSEQLAQVAQLSDVLWVEPFVMPKILNDVATGIMNVPTAWNLGYTGAGQTVTIADTGIDTGVDTATVGDIHLDFDNRVDHIHSWPVQGLYGETNTGADDGAADINSGHGTHVTGSVAGNGAQSSNTIRGAAYEADITFQAIEQHATFGDGSSDDGLYGIPSDIKLLFAEANGWGSRIHTNSWGADAAGAYTSDSRSVDQFIWDNKDFTILFAAGNAGVDANSDGYIDEGSVGSPATAKNAITIGASDNVRTSGGYQFQWATGSWTADYPTDPTKTDLISDSAEEMAAFSSTGPTADERIKPDLVAPGTNILSTRSSLATGTGWGTPPNAYYMYDGGTSMATPLAAGAAAVVRDYLVDGEGIASPSAALIKAILINTAEDIEGYGVNTEEAGQPIPNMHEGWGRINIGAAISATNRTLYNDDPSRLLSTGDSFTAPFTVTGTTDALKVTLVWSDYPGNTSATTQLVNDLNLVVTAPDGSTTYKGNVFSDGWSTTGGITDTVNNVENVYVHNPVTGTWTIEVVGADVRSTSLPNGGPQPFSLVVSGATAPPAPVLDKFIYLPLILNNYCAGCPTAGFWESGTGDEFYVTTDHANVDNFAIYVSACSTTYKITHSPQEPITNDAFAFTGSFYASGTFDSTTTANGTDGLDSFYINGCGNVSGGPWNWTASWQNNTQPTRILNTTLVQPDDGQTHPAHKGITVTKVP